MDLKYTTEEKTSAIRFVLAEVAKLLQTQNPNLAPIVMLNVREHGGENVALELAVGVNPELPGYPVADEVQSTWSTMLSRQEGLCRATVHTVNGRQLALLLIRQDRTNPNQRHPNKAKPSFQITQNLTIQGGIHQDAAELGLPVPPPWPAWTKNHPFIFDHFIKEALQAAEPHDAQLLTIILEIAHLAIKKTKNLNVTQFELKQNITLIIEKLGEESIKGTVVLILHTNFAPEAGTFGFYPEMIGEMAIKGTKISVHGHRIAELRKHDFNQINEQAHVHVVATQLLAQIATLLRCCSVSNSTLRRMYFHTEHAETLSRPPFAANKPITEEIYLET